MDWNPFYTTVAAATATVMGLLFVAVQLSSEKLKIDDKRPYRALAFSTFNILMVVFLLPVCFLVPVLGPAGRAIVVFIIAGFGLVRIIRNWFPLNQNPFLGRRERVWQMVWHILGPLLAYLFLLVVGFQLLLDQSQDSNFHYYQIAFTLVFLFSVGIRNSWNLVVEMAFDRQK